MKSSKQSERYINVCIAHIVHRNNVMSSNVQLPMSWAHCYEDDACLIAKSYFRHVSIMMGAFRAITRTRIRFPRRENMPLLVQGTRSH